MAENDRRDDRGEDWVEVHVAAGLAEADLLRSMLEAAGIDVRIEAETSAAMLAGFPTFGRFVKVQVPGADLEEAVLLIEEARQGKGLEDEAE